MNKSLVERLGKKAYVRSAVRQGGETEQSAKDTAGGSAFVAEFAKWLALLVTVSTLFLTLLGYGHDIAYLEQFGLRSEELQRTPLDFLLRAWYPVVAGLDGITKLGTVATGVKLLTVLWEHNWWWLLLVPLAWMLIFLCRKRLRTSMVKAYELAKVPAQATVDWFKRNRCLLAGWLVFPIFFGGALLILVGIYVVVGAFILLPGGIPALGVASGATRAKEVLAAQACRPSFVGEGGRCVRVVRDEKELARGFLIDYGGGRIYLYHPCDKSVRSLSLERSLIETVADGPGLGKAQPCVQAPQPNVPAVNPVPMSCPSWSDSSSHGPVRPKAQRIKSRPLCHPSP
jgi:hypothetical protein